MAFDAVPWRPDPEPNPRKRIRERPSLAVAVSIFLATGVVGAAAGGAVTYGVVTVLERIQQRRDSENILREIYALSECPQTLGPVSPNSRCE